MRISDWSSDVCSSDLQVGGAVVGEFDGARARLADRERVTGAVRLHHRGVIEHVRVGERQPIVERDCAGIDAREDRGRKRRFEGRAQGEARVLVVPDTAATAGRSEEHTSELQSLMRISYAVFCLKK